MNRKLLNLTINSLASLLKIIKSINYLKAIILSLVYISNS